MFVNDVVLYPSINKEDNILIYIYAVHKNAETGVIEKLKCTDGRSEYEECTKKFMINYIKDYPDSVKTLYKRGTSWIEGEYVHVVDNEYLRTDANYKREDNLGELIEY